MKRIVFGTGKLSDHLLVGHDVIAIPRIECDISEVSQVKSKILKYKPDVVINCAAKTSLEFCEENKKEAYLTG